MKREVVKLMTGCIAACLIVCGCGSNAAAENAAASAESTAITEDIVESADIVESTAAETESAVPAEDIASEAVSSEDTAVEDAAAASESEEVLSAVSAAESTEEANSESEQTQTAEEPDPDEGLLVIGEKAEGDQVYRIVFTNLSERNITELRIKDIYAGSYPDNMMPEGTVFANGEKAVLYFDASPEEEVTESTAEEAEKKEYTIRVTFDNGKMKDMTSFPFDDMTEAELYFDEDLLHAVYTSISTGEVTDTSGREKALRGEAQRAKEEAARAAREAASAGSSGGASAGTNTGGANECIDDDQALTW